MPDASEIIERMRAAAKARPDYVYQTPDQPWLPQGDCVYFEGGDNTCPSCLVGHGIAPLVGPDAFELRQLPLDDDAPEDENVFEVKRFHLEDQDSRAVIDWLSGSADLDCTPEQGGWIAYVQAAQDRKTPWGAAIAEADEIHPTVAIAAGRDDD